MPGLRAPEPDRFMRHVRKDQSGCWEWTAYRMPNGYGHFRTPRRHELAHRASYRLFKGPLIDGLDVMHSCDNPSCVNPEHLSQGTRTDNMRDAKAKRRMARGSRHGRSKLTEIEARFAKSCGLPQAETAAILGVSQSHISAIRSGKRWADLALESSHR